MLRTHRSLEGLFCKPVMNMMMFILLSHFNGAPVEWNWQGKTEVIGEKIAAGCKNQYSMLKSEAISQTGRKCWNKASENVYILPSAVEF